VSTLRGLATVNRLWFARPGLPLEIARSQKRYAINFGVALAGLLLLWFLPDYMDLPNSVFRMLTLTMLYTIGIMGLNLVFGYAGQVTLGPAAVYAVGAFVSGVLSAKQGWSPLASVPAGVVAAAVVGVLIGVPALRVGGFYLAMVTAFAAQAVPATANIFKDLTGGQDGLIGIPPFKLGDSPIDIFARYRLAILLMALTALLVAAMARSAWGRWFRCLTVSEVATSALGVSVYRAKVVAFLLSAIFGGLAGAVYAHFQQVISPFEFGFDLSLTLFASLVIGGLGTLWGPVLGTFLFFLGPHYLLPDRWGPAWAQVIYGVVLILVMLVIPDGVAGVVPALRRYLPFPQAQPHATVQPPKTGTDYGASVAALPNGARDVMAALLKRPERHDGAALQAVGVVKHFGGVRALENASLSVESGRITALIGPNGSGKTTLLNACSGFITPGEGKIFLAGRDVTQLPAYRRAQLGLARTFQQAVVFRHLTGAESVMAGYAEHRPSALSALFSLPSSRRHEREGAARAEAILDGLGAAHLVTKSGEDLSLAESRILDIARALAARPLVLLLDEPAAGLDLAEVEVLAGIIRAARDAGVGVLLVEHDVAFVISLADTVVVLDQGQVISEGTPEAIRADERVVAAYFGAVEPAALAGK
jgi:ABC-type branched-subunit amino acid transport system ATPase component/ABC-type branched-subunit amino acid transport system permease subunit